MRASAVVVAFSTTCGTQALAVDLKAQGPWIYSVPNDHGAEPEERVVMARAQNSEDVWLVLACARQAPAHIAIINKAGLSVPITGPVNVRLTFGEDAGFNLRADPIGEMSLFLRSSDTRHLLRAIRDSTVLEVAYSDRADGVKSYTWQLKPNDLAFAGMNAACHLDKP